MVFGQHLFSELHSEEQVFHPWNLVLEETSHHAIHMFEHVIVHCDNVMQCNFMLLCHPQGPKSKGPQYFHDIPHYSPLILSCEKWLEITVFWIVEPLGCEFLYSAHALK